jgi:RNA polymerase subunit RPABC4/transcription elongation factor Spt4
MSQKECPSCAMQIPSDSEICPVCEFEFSHTGQTRKGMIFFIIILCIIISLVTWYRTVFLR